jgi:hypothetical protein
LAIALEGEFPGQVTVNGLKDPGVTGRFEVTLKETGEVISSKEMGNGRCETSAQKQVVIDKVQAYLDSL